MKWFNLLKNKTGKLVLKAPQLLTIAGVGLLASYSIFQADKKVAEQERVRSLSSLSGSSDYEGLQLDNGGRLTSINIRDGLNQIATPEERARMEGGNAGGNFGLDAADNLGKSVNSSLHGRAAETSETDGLGIGRNATIIEEGSTSGGGAQVPGANDNRVGGRMQGKNPPTGTSGGKTLTPTSAPQGSGGGVSNVSYGGSNGSGSLSNGGNSGHGAREGYKLSGEMSAGTNPVSLREGGGSHSTSSFLASRNVSSGRGKNSRGSGNDLSDIAKRSAEAAGNQYRSNTEGSRAFLASHVDSGGMSIGGEGDGGGLLGRGPGGSEDFKAPLARNLQSIQTNVGEKEDEKAKQRDEDRNTLFKWMIAAIAAAALAIPIISALMTASESPYTQALKALAWVVAVAALVPCGFAIGKAIKYWSDYGFGWMSGGALAIGAAGAAAIIITVIQGARGKLKAKNYGQKISGYLKTFGTTVGTKAIGELKNLDAQDSKKK